MRMHPDILSHQEIQEDQFLFNLRGIEYQNNSGSLQCSMENNEIMLINKDHPFYLSAFEIFQMKIAAGFKSIHRIKQKAQTH